MFSSPLCLRRDVVTPVVQSRTAHFRTVHAIMADGVPASQVGVLARPGGAAIQLRSVRLGLMPRHVSHLLESPAASKTIRSPQSVDAGHWHHPFCVPRCRASCGGEKPDGVNDAGSPKRCAGSRTAQSRAEEGSRMNWKLWLCARRRRMFFPVPCSLSYSTSSSRAISSFACRKLLS